MTGPLKRVAQLRVKALDLTSARFGFFGSSLGAGGELSRRNGGHDKGEQRDPVVGGGDCERAASDTVAALKCAPTILSSSVNAPTLNTATTYPADLWSNTDRCMSGIVYPQITQILFNLVICGWLRAADDNKLCGKFHLV